MINLQIWIAHWLLAAVLKQCSNYCLCGKRKSVCKASKSVAARATGSRKEKFIKEL